MREEKKFNFFLIFSCVLVTICVCACASNFIYSWFRIFFFDFRIKKFACWANQILFCTACQKREFFGFEKSLCDLFTYEWFMDDHYHQIGGQLDLTDRQMEKKSIAMTTTHIDSQSPLTLLELIFSPESRTLFQSIFSQISIWLIFNQIVCCFRHCCKVVKNKWRNWNSMMMIVHLNEDKKFSFLSCFHLLFISKERHDDDPILSDFMWFDFQGIKIIISSSKRKTKLKNFIHFLSMIMIMLWLWLLCYLHRTHIHTCNISLNFPFRIYIISMMMMMMMIIVIFSWILLTASLFLFVSGFQILVLEPELTSSSYWVHVEEK